MLKTFLSALALALMLALPHGAAAQWYGEIYGGAVLERDEEYGAASMSVDSGTTFGIGIYNTAVLAPVEIGVDLMSTNADYSGMTTSVDSLSLMAVARVSNQVAPGTTLYAGLGLGAIQVEYNGAPAASGDDTVGGAQIELGVRYNVGAGTIFAAVKHQEAFDDAVIQGVTQSYGATSVIAGWRFSF